MPRVHGRSPEAFPGVLARHRAVFSDDELTSGLRPDGSWEVVISDAGWLRHFGGKPGVQEGSALIGYLAHGTGQRM